VRPAPRQPVPVGAAALHEILFGGATFFGPSTVHEVDEPAPLWGKTPSFLEAFFEPHALMVSGILSERDWSTCSWRTRGTSHSRPSSRPGLREATPHARKARDADQRRDLRPTTRGTDLRITSTKLRKRAA